MALIPHLLLRILDLAGVAVFAASGALAAGRKRLDLFGVCVVAIVTAIGGGTLRDIFLGRLPVFWVSDSIYVPVILAATVFTIVFTRFRVPSIRLLLIADAFGLALFSISGAEIARSMGFSWIVVLSMGPVSGVAGGMMRDVLCNEIPLVLRGRHLYASAALGGTAIYAGLYVLGIAPAICAGIGILVVLILRLASILFGFGLPVYALPDHAQDPPA